MNYWKIDDDILYFWDRQTGYWLEAGKVLKTEDINAERILQGGADGV